MSVGDPPIINPYVSSGVTLVNPGSGYTYSIPNTVTAATTTGYTTTIPFSGYSGAAYPPDMNVAGAVTAKDFKIDGVSLKDTLNAIQDRLAILVPDLEKHEKYAALKAAYDQYKLLEALIGDGDNLPKQE